MSTTTENTFPAWVQPGAIVVEISGSRPYQRLTRLRIAKVTRTQVVLDNGARWGIARLRDDHFYARPRGGVWEPGVELRHIDDPAVTKASVFRQREDALRKLQNAVLVMDRQVRQLTANSHPDNMRLVEESIAEVTARAADARQALATSVGDDEP